MAGKFSYKVGNHSDKGMVRANNQDSFGSAKNSWGEIYIVADGMGGHKGGEVASQMTVSHITDSFKQADKNVKPVEFLEKSIQKANQLVVKKGKENKALEGMGTTIVCILMTGNISHIAHVGDSRLYIFRYNKPYFVTKDHSVVQDLLDKGLITAKEAENHPNKNKILQAIGTGNITPSITIEKLYKGDSILLCSDGLTGEVKVNNIHSVIKMNEPVVATERLIARANKNGGSDNITAIVIKVDKGSLPPKQPQIKSNNYPVSNQKSYRYLFSGVLIGVTITTLIVFGYKWIDKLKKDKQEIEVKIIKSPEIDTSSAIIDSTLIDTTKFGAASEEDAEPNESLDTTSKDDSEPKTIEGEIKDSTFEAGQSEKIEK